MGEPGVAFGFPLSEHCLGHGIGEAPGDEIDSAGLLPVGEFAAVDGELAVGVEVAAVHGRWERGGVGG